MATQSSTGKETNLVMKRGILGLAIRERGSQRQTNVPLTARAVSSWIESLPVANIGETARQVYQFLVDCNGQPVDPVERLKVMQAVQHVVTHVGDALRKHYISQSVSLNEKQRKIAALAQAMQSEMAIGYKTVLEEALSDDHQKMNSQVLAPAVHGAVHYLSLVLLRCYQLYSQQPAHIWKELHTLFLFAEQNQLLHSSVNNESIGRAYMRMVLTSCANPYQLRQREIEQMFEALGSVSDKANLVTFSRDEGLYYIDLHADIGPQNVALASTAPAETWRTLALEDLVQHLQDELRSASQVQIGVQRSPLQQLGSPLLRHLVRAFGNLTTRAFSRTPTNGGAKLAIGLSATHFLLAGEDSPLNQSGDELKKMEGSLREATLVIEEAFGPGRHNKNGTPIAGDPFGSMYLMQGAQNSLKGASEDISAPGSFTANAEVRYDFQVAAMVNISPGGYCLALRGSIPNQTQTGEIIGLMETDGDGIPHWNIGTIRWMKRVPDAALQIGIQLIAPNARPVMTQVRSSQMSGVSFQRSLLLPALKGIGQPATLITAPMPYALNQKVRVKEEERTIDVRLSKQVAASASFKQFQFEETVTQPEEPAAGSKLTKPHDDNFDNVWELI